jgi:hypothetical protein
LDRIWKKNTATQAFNNRLAQAQFHPIHITKKENPKQTEAPVKPYEEIIIEKLGPVNFLHINLRK